MCIVVSVGELRGVRWSSWQGKPGQPEHSAQFEAKPDLPLRLGRVTCKADERLAINLREEMVSLELMWDRI